VLQHVNSFVLELMMVQILGSYMFVIISKFEGELWSSLRSRFALLFAV